MSIASDAQLRELSTTVRELEKRIAGLEATVLRLVQCVAPSKRNNSKDRQLEATDI